MFYIPKLSGAHCKLGNLMKQNDGHHSVLSSLLFLRLIFILFFHLLDIFGCCTSFVCLSLWGYTRICVAVLAARKKKTTSETASHCLLVVILVRAVVWLRTRPRIVCYGAKVTRHHTQSHTTNVTQETRKKRREKENIRAHDDTTNWATRENSTNIGQ